MGEVVNLHPVLDEKLFEKIGYEIKKLELSYVEDYEEFPLCYECAETVPVTFSSQINDPRCVWYPDSHNIILRKTIQLHNCESLFGVNGIAVKNAKLGVAINWISSKSEHRGIIPVGEFDVSTNEKMFEVEYKFERSILRGCLTLQTILYIRTAGTPEEDEMFLANTSGMLLGTLDHCDLFVDGNGSVFPIATVNEPGRPLWYVYYDKACDPLQDSFDEENVEIRLNTAHPAYETLKIEGSLKESPLFLEVLSSALLVIVETAKESLGTDWDNVINGQGFERGSIAEAIYYFVSKLQWDTNSPTVLSESIHQFFDTRLQGGLL